MPWDLWDVLLWCLSSCVILYCQCQVLSSCVVCEIMLTRGGGAHQSMLSHGQLITVVSWERVDVVVTPFATPFATQGLIITVSGRPLQCHVVNCACFGLLRRSSSHSLPLTCHASAGCIRGSLPVPGTTSSTLCFHQPATETPLY